MPECIQRNVSPTPCDLNYRVDDVADSRRIHSSKRPQGAGQTERFIGDIYRYNFGAYRVANHDCRQTNASAPVNRYPLSGRGLALIYDRTKGRRKAATQTGRRSEIQLLRQTHKIRIGVMNGHKLCKRSPVCETRLKLVLADLLIPG